MKTKCTRMILTLVCFTMIALTVVFTSGCDLFAQKITIEGVSMDDTLHDGDIVTLKPLDGKPRPGDIIAFAKSEGYTKPMVKRVIAVEGQELKIDFENDRVYVDGELLDEPYILGTTKPGDIPEEEINGVIPAGKVFVMGDNRNVSLDSRDSVVGLVDVGEIMGVVRQ